jgi:nitrile hydratase subunit beta
MRTSCSSADSTSWIAPSAVTPRLRVGLAPRCEPWRALGCRNNLRHLGKDPVERSEAWPGRRRDNVGQVSRVHDMGGQTGFGPVPTEDDGQFFHADWEARVYAIIRVLQRRGVINAAFDDLRDAIERIPPAEYLTMSYYERWLRAAEMLLAERRLLAGD